MCSVWTARPPAAPERGAHTPGTGEGVGYIRGFEECTQCDGTNEYILPAHRGTGEGAGDDRSVISVHNTYSCMGVGCGVECRVQRVRLTVNKQTNKQATTSHSPVSALLTPSKPDKGSAAEVRRECTRDASTEWTTHVALTVCVAGHRQRARLNNRHMT